MPVLVNHWDFLGLAVVIATKIWLMKLDSALSTFKCISFNPHTSPCLSGQWVFSSEFRRQGRWGPARSSNLPFLYNQQEATSKHRSRWLPIPCATFFFHTWSSGRLIDKDVCMTSPNPLWVRLDLSPTRPVDPLPLCGFSLPQPHLFHLYSWKCSLPLTFFQMAIWNYLFGWNLPKLTKGKVWCLLPLLFPRKQ